MSRILEFDAVRGVAALAIVVNHIFLPHVVPLSSAVNLFFVLSGYLITAIILKNRDVDRFLPSFYGRRALRIWPIYYLALAFLVGYNAVAPVTESLEGLGYYLTYTQKIQFYWFGEESPFARSFRHTWTLAVEEQFYIFWPLLLCARKEWRVLPLALGMAAVSFAARGVGFSGWILLTQLDGLAFGAALAAVVADPAVLTRRRSGFRAGCLLIALGTLAYTFVGARALRGLGPAWHPWISSSRALTTNLFFAAFVGLLVCQAGHRRLAALRWRPLVYLGQISYGLYLYHCIVMFKVRGLLAHYGLPGGRWADVLIMAASVAVAALSWEFVERPILALKDRFAYRTPPARRPAAVRDFPGLVAAD